VFLGDDEASAQADPVEGMQGYLTIPNSFTNAAAKLQGPWEECGTDSKKKAWHQWQHRPRTPYALRKKMPDDFICLPGRFTVIYAFAAMRAATPCSRSRIIEKSYGNSALRRSRLYDQSARARRLVGRNGHGKSTLFA